MRCVVSLSKYHWSEDCWIVSCLGVPACLFWISGISPFLSLFFSLCQEVSYCQLLCFRLLLLQCLLTFNSANLLRNVVSCFTVFRVSCDRYNLTEELFNSLTKKCRLIENLFLETYGYPRKAFPFWSFSFCYFQVCSSSHIVWQVR